MQNLSLLLELAPEAFHRRFWLEAGRSLSAHAASSALHRSALLELVHQKPALVAELMGRHPPHAQSSASALALGSVGLHCFAAPHLPPHLGVGLDSGAHAHASASAVQRTTLQSDSVVSGASTSTRKRPALLLELDEPHPKHASGSQRAFTSMSFFTLAHRQ